MDVEFAKTLGQRIRSVREGRNLTREVVAARAGFHKNFIGYVERGDQLPSAESLVRIAAALEVSAASLLGESEAVQQTPPAAGETCAIPALKSPASVLFADRFMRALEGWETRRTGSCEPELEESGEPEHLGARAHAHVDHVLASATPSTARALVQILRAFSAWQDDLPRPRPHGRKSRGRKTTRRRPNQSSME